MNRAHRIWHIGIFALFLALLLSCRLLYWQLLWEEGAATAVAVSSGEGEEQPPGPPTVPPSATDSADPHASLVSPATGTPSPSPQPTATTRPSPSPTPTVDPATIPRGTIYDRNGRALAYDLHRDGNTLLRFYSEPSLAHVVGYLSGARRGVSGIEAAYDETLLRIDESSTPAHGSDLLLTIDSRIQRAAAEALTGTAGAIVVLNSDTGAVLAMASSPTFDPNRILEPDYLTLLENCAAGLDCRQPLLNRATQGLYPPGSTWKTVTLMAALDSGQVSADTVFDFGEPLRDENGQIYYVYRVDGFSIHDPNHTESRLTLQRSYAVSANAAFAQMGDEMPPEVMLAYAARLGFGRDEAPPLPIEASAARLARNPQALHTDNPLRASTAIGQGELLASPLSLALVTAAVVNEGDVPDPYLVGAVRTPAGVVREVADGGVWIEDAVQPQTAALVRDMMIEVVRSGSGGQAQVPGLTVGGKTGTAQVGGDSQPHAWFTGFVEDGSGHTLVITVLVENGGSGSQVAAPLFAQVADIAIYHANERVEEIVPEPTSLPANGE